MAIYLLPHTPNTLLVIESPQSWYTFIVVLLDHPATGQQVLQPPRSRLASKQFATSYLSEQLVDEKANPDNGTSTMDIENCLM
jgi:hypothetical protein